MNEIETDFIKFRLATILILILVLDIALLSRAFQLQVLSSEILKERYNQQHAKALETGQLIKDLQYSLDKLSAEQKKLITDTIILSGEKAKLLTEIDELKPKYNKLFNDVQLLQKMLRDLSILQEKEAEHIVRIYDQIYRKEKWSSFITSFLMGVITSVIASIIYNSVAKRNNMPSMGYLINIIKKRLIHMKKE
jgi:predicted nuclease with TOPRIM domain